MICFGWEIFGEGCWGGYGGECLRVYGFGFVEELGLAWVAAVLLWASWVVQPTPLSPQP